MDSLESELARARDLDVGDLADAIESIGFECTRCGACCKGHPADGGADDSDPGHPEGSDAEAGEEAHEPHTATVFPDEVRRLQAATGGEGDGAGGGSEEYDWRDVARPMPYGLREGPDGPEGETFEWALQVDDCGDCTFYAEDDGGGRCTVHPDRPLICRTYPFSVALGGTSQPMGEAVDREGMVRAHECEGLGRDISRSEAEDLAAALKERAVRELEEAVAVRNAYDPVETGPGEVVVHDSEGAKRPDGRPVGDGDR
ncbi:zinc/iron-chelating domain-containing protein [Halobacteriales archaeon QS_8_69_26]|nr:MAG: zinc/iron-chelating domain-containing protein [Halobacteriales archaeon QS_8_69_26]